MRPRSRLRVLRGALRRRARVVGDLIAEALAGVAARPARLVLTTLGTVLGVASLVATIGLAQTASGQIADRFDAVTATQVQVEPRMRPARSGQGQETVAELPWDAPDRVGRLNGVVAAGTFTAVDTSQTGVRSVPVVDPDGAGTHQLPVVAGSAGLLEAVRGRVVTGRFFDAGHDQRADPVAVLGANAAERLHITRIGTQPAVFVGDTPLTVIGIIDDVVRRTALLDAVIVPNGTAVERFDLASPDALHIRTALGAAQVVGAQATVALAPNRPEGFTARVPPSPSELEQQVQTDVNVLFLVLAGIALLAGGFGIANVTLLSVLERVGEIGLRRALGATRPQVALQFLLESMTVGLLGGLVGAAGGVLTTVGVAVVRGWTPVLDVRLAVGAPLLGGLIGLVAGTYPAIRASAVEPVTALRSGM